MKYSLAAFATGTFLVSALNLGKPTSSWTPVKGSDWQVGAHYLCTIGYVQGRASTLIYDVDEAFFVQHSDEVDGGYESIGDGYAAPLQDNYVVLRVVLSKDRRYARPTYVMDSALSYIKYAVDGAGQPVCSADTT